MSKSKDWPARTAKALRESREVDFVSDEVKPGDIVTLKSSGPMMTVDSIDANGNCWLAWFVGTEVRWTSARRESLVRHGNESGLALKETA